MNKSIDLLKDTIEYEILNSFEKYFHVDISTSTSMSYFLFCPKKKYADIEKYKKFTFDKREFKILLNKE